MDRRAFLKSGAYGLGGLTLAGSNLTWMIQDAVAAAANSGTPWKFGIMADTQWANANDIANPGYCAVNIIQAVNQQFINAGVKFVVQVGDLVDQESWKVTSASGYNDPLGNAVGSTARTLPYRAWAAQSLYDAGIGFFPLRGNHEPSQTAATELKKLFPQTTGTDKLYGATDVVPSSISGLVGLSYAFDFANVRIVMIDQFTRTDGTGTDQNSNTLDQVSWVDSTLSSRTSGTHAFVMGHKNLIGQDHVDCLFGASPTANISSRDTFINSLQSNGVGFYFGGHDHMHHRSVIANSTSTAKVNQVISSSDSYKFYTPASTPNDTTGRETVVAQELWTIGYYIVTVDGPCVTIDFYSSSVGHNYASGDLSTSPASYTFYRRERFGYSLNGQEFDIAIGGSYTGVQDSYASTTARILSGSNGDTAAVASDGRKESKTVKTGWRDQPVGAASAILKLWGLDNNLDLNKANTSGTVLLPNADADYVTDTYVLSLSYDPTLVRPTQLGTGFCLAAQDANGNWVNAVDLNEGGTKKLVIGAWKSSYTLGTYGVDPSTHTVWAVLNRDGQFVARSI